MPCNRAMMQNNSDIMRCNNAIMLCNSAIKTCNNAVISFNNAICRTKTLLDRYYELHFWGGGGGGGGRHVLWRDRVTSCQIVTFEALYRRVAAVDGCWPRPIMHS